MPGIIEKLRAMMLGPRCEDSDGTAPALVLRIRCKRCGEEITTRIEKAHALQEQYEMVQGERGEEPELSGYLLQKEFLGAKCQNLIALTMHLDPCTRPLKHEMEGGELLEVRDSD
jgi:hypothetical protein